MSLVSPLQTRLFSYIFLPYIRNVHRMSIITVGVSYKRGGVAEHLGTVEISVSGLGNDGVSSKFILHANAMILTLLT